MKFLCEMCCDISLIKFDGEISIKDAHTTFKSYYDLLKYDKLILKCNNIFMHFVIHFSIYFIEDLNKKCTNHVLFL